MFVAIAHPFGTPRNVAQFETVFGRYTTVVELVLHPLQKPVPTDVTFDKSIEANNAHVFDAPLQKLDPTYVAPPIFIVVAA